MRRVIVVGAVLAATVLACIATFAVISSQGPPTAVALAKVRQERPGVSWRVTEAALYLSSARVYDAHGRLRESRSVGCPPLVSPFRLLDCIAPPEWVVELNGSDSRSDYDAIVDVSPIGWRTGSWQIASTPRTENRS